MEGGGGNEYNQWHRDYFKNLEAKNKGMLKISIK